MRNYHNTREQPKRLLAWGFAFIVFMLLATLVAACATSTQSPTPTIFSTLQPSSIIENAATAEPNKPTATGTSTAVDTATSPATGTAKHTATIPIVASTLTATDSALPSATIKATAENTPTPKESAPASTEDPTQNGEIKTYAQEGRTIRLITDTSLNKYVSIGMDPRQEQALYDVVNLRIQQLGGNETGFDTVVGHANGNIDFVFTTDVLPIVNKPNEIGFVSNPATKERIHIIKDENGNLTITKKMLLGAMLNEENYTNNVKVLSAITEGLLDLDPDIRNIISAQESQGDLGLVWDWSGAPEQGEKRIPLNNILTEHAQEFQSFSVVVQLKK